MSERPRPHHPPAARCEVLEIRNLLGSNQARAADQFLVSENTISNWERDQSPESRAVGSLAKPVLPVIRFNDATRHLGQMMARFGFGGAEMIASHLALAGFRVAEKTVRNIKREKVIIPAMPPPDSPRPSNPVVANFVHHVGMMDVTVFKTLFGAKTLYFAAAFDAFSRMPLAGMAFDVEPDSAAVPGRGCRVLPTEIPHHRPRRGVHRGHLREGRGAPWHEAAVRGSRQHPSDGATGAILEDAQGDRPRSLCSPTQSRET